MKKIGVVSLILVLVAMTMGCDLFKESPFVGSYSGKTVTDLGNGWEEKFSVSCTMKDDGSFGMNISTEKSGPNTLVPETFLLLLQGVYYDKGAKATLQGKNVTMTATLDGNELILECSDTYYLPDKRMRLTRK